MFTRRKVVVALAGSVVAVGVGTPIDAFVLEPYWVVVENSRFDFAADRTPPVGMTIVQLSDIHHSDMVPRRYLERCVEQCNELQPDLIVLTGDYITGGLEWIEPLGEIFAPLSAPLGVFAVFGNHDGGVWASRHGGGLPDTTLMGQALETAGIRTLVNERIELVHRGVHFELVGLGDLWAGQFHPELAFHTIDRDRFTIVLSHNPDTIPALKEFRTDLILCGHTHGGQVSIPFIGPPILPIKQRQYSGGSYEIGSKKIYVNRGVGLVRKVRFNCRPEIACLEIG
jgi:uncharacterized protein